MRRMTQLLTFWLAGFVALSFLAAIPAGAQGAPVTIDFRVDKGTFQPGEAVKMQIDVGNYTGSDVISRRGFLGQDFHLMITFTDPDGKPVYTRFPPSSTEPGPPYRFEDEDAVLAEVIPARVSGSPNRTVVIDDARAFYDLSKYGRYTAQVFASLETFGRSLIDPDAGLIAFLNNPPATGYSIASDKVAFELVRPSTAPLHQTSVQVHVDLYRIGWGIKPIVKKVPLENVPVHLIPVSEVPDDCRPINFKTYEMILNHISYEHVRTAYTNHKGLAVLERVPKDDYVLIGVYNGTADFKHMGAHVFSWDPDWKTGRPIVKHLMVMEKATGKKMPCNTSWIKGSDLLIIEPEYVVWDSDQELYPFVFESVGDWSVTTTVTPPEGFTADREAITANVQSEIEAVQFTITDVGSRWEEVKATHRIKHKGRQRIIRSLIGVKLTERLAVEKGLSIFGHTGNPGRFKAGRRVHDNDGEALR